MNRSDELVTENKVDEAVIEYSVAMEMFLDNAKMVFWPAVGQFPKDQALLKKILGLTPKK